MAAPLVDIPADQIKATYYVLGGILELKAKGEVPGVWFTPFFERETLLGGLLYSIRDFVGGVLPPGTKPPPPKPFDISTKLHITLPEPHFNSKTVAVQTAKGTWHIPIEYLGFVSADGDKPTVLADSDEDKGNPINEGSNTKDVLPPIKERLPAGGKLTLRALIPQAPPLGKVIVTPHFNPEYFKLVNSTHEAGAITFTFEWNKLPTGTGENPQIIDITTTIYNGLIGASSVSSTIIQGYLVYFIVFDETK